MLCLLPGVLGTNLRSLENPEKMFSFMHEVGQHMALYALPLPGVLGSNLEPTFENPELRFSLLRLN